MVGQTKLLIVSNSQSVQSVLFSQIMMKLTTRSRRNSPTDCWHSKGTQLYTVSGRPSDLTGRLN